LADVGYRSPKMRNNLKFLHTLDVMMVASLSYTVPIWVWGFCADADIYLRLIRLKNKSQGTVTYRLYYKYLDIFVKTRNIHKNTYSYYFSKTLWCYEFIPIWYGFISIRYGFISIWYGFISTFVIDMILNHVDMSSYYFEMKKIDMWKLRRLYQTSIVPFFLSVYTP